ncbi:hypothetical protein conserved [Leishmania donovani]|uniref:Uncharacterized protein n=3 Tax=Leishmania donovani species complex TaxID=38574 RepID=A4I1B9_LEIIN|nr:hypothetical protein, unknown function [Leishmania infantum JPCM5]CAC9493843.1 hypothetical_protein_-_conserved [Leishmania infantum]CAJ1989404.1 hypothetical protein conserved [Leishmania donovani]CAM68548.1 hypothetical protein, unknown function [Leishmania infantum JPCM5]SUZ42405.1 hypothetical_protein_-_conserved [Leishmania infantum]VDZ45271.1 hypothetical_protein_conserved [Leishmania donovani]|eukprot:XP_001466110.1 hypothetical protein, unknown function [Leishmania infantum JPCM5]
MGQSASSSQENPSTGGGFISSAIHYQSRRAGRAESPAMEVQSMLCTLNFPPSASGAGAEGVDSPTCTVSSAGNASGAAAAIPILCLDASALDIRQLLKSLELPPAQCAKALQEASRKASGVLLHAPANTSVDALRQFLLAQTTSSASANTVDSGALTLHLFALRHPLLSIADGAAADVTPSCGAAEASSNSLVALAESMELSELSMNNQLFFFPLLGASETDCNPLAKNHVGAGATDSYWAALRREEAEVEEAAAASLSVGAGDPPITRRALVLLYTHETRFGFDGDDLLLLGCCASICACIAAGICCCMDAAKNNQQPNHVNTKPNYYGGNGVPQYYNNGAGNAYYGQQPQQSYYNSGAPGYGMPPNAYANTNTNVLQPQPLHQNYYGGGYQYQPQNQQLNGIPIQSATYVPSAPAAGPL